jgi:diaminopimelate decarboxylase
MELKKYTEQFEHLETPFYFYDIDLLKKTFAEAKLHVQTIQNSMLHLAMKANYNETILRYAQQAGFGIDAVSGGEILRADQLGFSHNKIVFAGVGKTDKEILIALDRDILCFNVESIDEIDIINNLAGKRGKNASLAIRINPNIDAHTHKNITTGLKENKFGIELEDLIPTILKVQNLPNVNYYGLHFHIGSQIMEYSCFVSLCHKINEIQDTLESLGIHTHSINIGGGLGVDYESPQEHPIPDFKGYFNIFKNNLKLRPGQTFHCELGRALTAQYGALISRVIFVKKARTKQFAILDAGFTDLIRPSLYQAHHKAINLTSNKPQETYDIVGPICETTDTFEENATLPQTQRGDLVALLSAGAYGHVMASQYNYRELIKEITSEQLKKS